MNEAETRAELIDPLLKNGDRFHFGACYPILLLGTTCPLIDMEIL